MADDHDLELAKSGEKQLQKLDLRGADLGGADFFNADLSGSKLNQNTLINAILVAANLTEAHIVGADFSGADLRGAKLPRVAVAVKFVGASLRGTRVRLKGQQIDFRRADLVGADFTGSSFGEDVRFDDVLVDETSNFHGVEMLRATSRYPAFSAYNFEQGKLVRRDDVSAKSQPTFSAEPLDNNSKSEGGEIENIIAVRIKERPQDLSLMAAILSNTVRQELQNIKNNIPNEPAQLDNFNRYSSFLEELASSLERLSVEIREAAAAPQHHGYSRAARIVETMRERVELWCSENAGIVSGAKQTGMIGVGIAFLLACGAAPNLASVISAATFGGPKLMQAIKDHFSKVDN